MYDGNTSDGQTQLAYAYNSDDKVSILSDEITISTRFTSFGRVEDIVDIVLHKVYILNTLPCYISIAVVNIHELLKGLMIT